MDGYYSEFFILNYFLFTFVCTAIPLLDHVLSDPNEEFIVPWEELRYSLSIAVLSYVIGHRVTDMFNHTISLKFTVDKTLLQGWTQMIIARLRIVLI